MHCEMFSSTPSLYPLEANTLCSPPRCLVMTTLNTSRQRSPGWALLACREQELGHRGMLCGQKNFRSGFTGDCETAQGMLLPKAAVGKLADFVFITTHSDSRLNNQLCSSTLKNYLGLILFHSFFSSFWFLYLPIAAKWSFTVNPNFYVMIDSFLFFLFVFPYFSAPSGSKGNSFPSHPSHSQNSQVMHVSMVLCVLRCLWPVKWFPLTASETWSGAGTQRPTHSVSTNPLPHESHQRTLSWPVTEGWIHAQLFPWEFWNNRSRVSLACSFKYNIPGLSWNSLPGRQTVWIISKT